MKLKIKSIFAALLLCAVLPAFAETDYKTPKNEFRSTWVATVWALDWPSNRGKTEYIRSLQQKEMIKILDSLAVNNFNAVNFQVRGMSDAMYKSSYEPWSQYITGTRGEDPGWDPLEFVVEECHKRGMECHAWVNPYRFSTDGSDRVGDMTGYYEKGWLIQNPNGYRILNPSREDVQDHIVKVCKEIIDNYDIDGMLFDDYYYVSAAMSQDATEYAAYTAAGGTQSQADWRRGNVHSLMKKLYTMIQEGERPWVRFGQAPPGGTFQDSKRAAEYGIDPCPSGYENCYNSQYIDIMGWLKDGIIDYISPQVYWAIGYTVADYGKMVPWWGTVVNKFNRHLFVSQDISSVSSPDRTGVVSLSDSHERELKMTSGGSMTTFGEVEEQVALNRTSSLNGAFGSIFYSVGGLYSKTSSKPISLGHNLKRHLYSCPALPPAMTWKATSNPGTVANLNYDGASTLSWETMSLAKNNRYTVYAIPNGLAIANFDKQVKYLLGIAYDNSGDESNICTYTVPEDFRSGYYFAVCVYDRYGNEWDAAVKKNEYAETVATPVLTSPADGYTAKETFEFTWNAVDGAEKYAVDVAAQSDFIEIQKTVQVSTPALSSDEIYNYIDKNKTTYWRVRAIAGGKNDGVSEVRSFVYSMPEFTYPVNGATELDPKVNFTWDFNSDGKNVTVEVAEDEAFVNMVFTAESATGSYQTPACTLKPLTAYYARLSFDGKVSPVITFTTKYVAAEVPTFKFPLNGGTCWSNSTIAINPQEGVTTVIIQVDSSTSFKSTTFSQKKLYDFTFGVPASEIKLNKNRNALVDGNTYYARAYVEYLNEAGIPVGTDWSDVISFVYSSAESAIDNVAVGADVKLAGRSVVINADRETNVKVSAVSMLGREEVLYEGKAMSESVSLESLPGGGMYIIKVVLDNEVRTLKYMK